MHGLDLIGTSYLQLATFSEHRLKRSNLIRCRFVTGQLVSLVPEKEQEAPPLISSQWGGIMMPWSELGWAHRTIDA